MSRPAVPSELEREVLVEAGHRCAIPTCRQTPVEIAHIVPWEKVREHKFGNLIALCPTCHARYDRGEIDHKSMEIYKRNLSILNHRYNDFERRVLQVLGGMQATQIWLPGGLEILWWNLISDNLLQSTGKNSGVVISGVPFQELYDLTPKGQDFIRRWLRAEEIK